MLIGDLQWPQYANKPAITAPKQPSWEPLPSRATLQWVQDYIQDNGLADRVKLLRIYDMSLPRGAAHHTCSLSPVRKFAPTVHIVVLVPQWLSLLLIATANYGQQCIVSCRIVCNSYHIGSFAMVWHALPFVCHSSCTYNCTKVYVEFYTRVTPTAA